ncbi:hypothetical protein V491_00016, partial [Pseudogymnoascus sp. VKM F-3775]
MSPSPVEEQVAPTKIPILPGKDAAAAGNPAAAASTTASAKPWLKSSGFLDKFEYFEVTPVIGREYSNVDIVEWLQAPNSDELIKELAVTISERGVVFFRGQNNLTADLQKQLLTRLGQLSGRPKTSSLHIHPILNNERDNYRVSDPEISTIDSELDKKIYKSNEFIPKKQKAGAWHSDIAFEPVPADYSSLRLEKLPKTGGDTLWASGYEIYDRISPPYQKFLESLTATFEQPIFISAAAKGGFKLYDKERGNPANTGEDLTAVHPVVRTNPVTGWKSVYPIGGHVGHINGVTELESKALLEWFERLIVDNHDLQ